MDLVELQEKWIFLYYFCTSMPCKISHNVKIVAIKLYDYLYKTIIFLASSYTNMVKKNITKSIFLITNKICTSAKQFANSCNVNFALFG